MASTHITLNQEQRLEVLQQNLLRLTADLDAYAHGNDVCRGRVASPHPDCSLLARHMPLAHSQSAFALKSVAKEGRLCSPAEIARAAGANPPPPDKTKLDTDDFAFTYAGPFRYPNASCGFLFRAETEERISREAIAVPFDSGGVVHHLLPGQSLEVQKHFLRTHEMPVPEYRSYFERTLLLLFPSPWDYVQGSGPNPAGPIHIRRDDIRSWTFEVRFERELRLTGNLLAVFLPIAVAATEWVLPQRRIWESEGVHVRILPPTRSDWTILHSEGMLYVSDYLRSHAPREGTQNARR